MLLGTGCRSRADASLPNVLIVSLESMRWDHLGLSGYARPLTPNIDSLARRGVYFPRAYSQGTWTRPSIASTFVSAFQSTHRVRGNPDSLSERFQTLAEIFRGRGYRTYGWSNNANISAAFGFAQGFDEYNALIGKDPKIVASLKAAFHAPSRPFLAFVHLMGTHWPYHSSKEFDRYDRHKDAVSITADNWTEINQGMVTLTPEDVEHNLALYDGAIQEVDARVGEVMGFLNDAGLARNTIVVIMADHGEEFYERGRVGHGWSLADTLIRVPLVIAGPNLPEGRVVDIPVSNVDLLPTLSRLALASTPAFAQGRDLGPIIAGKAGDDGHPVFSESGDGSAIVSGEWKLIERGRRNEFYNILKDPQEDEDRIDDASVREIRERLSRMLQSFAAGNRRIARDIGDATKPVVSKEVWEQLRSLGYVK